MQAPDILIMTPQGRFEPNRKICIDGLTSFHEGSWRPAWGVRTAIVGLMSFWSQGGEALAGVGAMNCDKDERKRLAKLSAEWTCPVCQKSNAEIMHEHEESINVRQVEQFTKNAAVAASHAPGAAGGQAPEVPATPGLESATLSESNDSKTQVASLAPALHDHTSFALVTPSRRPPTITLNEHLTDPPYAVTPPIITRTFLKPPPAHVALAPVRLVHYHLCKLFCPVRYRQHMPPRPDTVLYLDTIICCIITALLVILFHKLARSWTRVLYLALTTLENVSGIDMSWITHRFDPSNPAAGTTSTPPPPPSAGTGGYHWASSGFNNGNAAAGGERTRLRNMDTAMRARDIVRRFGNGNDRVGAGGGAQGQERGRGDAAPGRELRARRGPDL
ncbi:hypothetical protein QFC22_006034 [Naganishia vaughanmartiniae]|uniref:Uncharacterized protein n=1 Tax=Naganishia vaughanmartiniae TaxID=1424756 RepID=A0ACC2WPE5_9TREE|nr:hypothetical protein QFC22_006034 [Naganishia vaughanmartiniae]